MIHLSQRFVLILGLGLIGCDMHYTNQGQIAEHISPHPVGGTLRVIAGEKPADATFLIFEDFGNADPNDVKDEWDSDETFSKELVRAVRADFQGNSEEFFKEYGQYGFWFISSDLRKFYVLVQWRNYQVEGRPLTYSFWRSTNGGRTFEKLPQVTELLKMQDSNVSDLYFDAQGQYGYIIVNPNMIWHTQDGGKTWRKHYFKTTPLSQLWDANKVFDTAYVSADGDLYFTVYEGLKDGNIGSQLYRLKHDEFESDISEMAAIDRFPGKRILALRPVPQQKGHYLFYFDCHNDPNCRWDVVDMAGIHKKEDNPNLQFAVYDQGEFKNHVDFGFFIPIKEIYLDQDSVGVSLYMPNHISAMNQLLIGRDYGKRWAVVDQGSGLTDYIDLKRNLYWRLRSQWVDGKDYMLHYILTSHLPKPTIQADEE